jgi:hypothetical protein
MATQRVTVATIGGTAAQHVAAYFRRWERQAAESRELGKIASAVDRFAGQLRAHAYHPPVIYFAEWIDLWSMGDLLPGLGGDRTSVVEGSRFHVGCHQSRITLAATTIDGEETQETDWLRAHLQAAEDAWGDLVPTRVIVVIREPLGPLVTDEELTESLHTIPPWLAVESIQE